MDNKQDVEKLFNEKFNDFSPELSPDALDHLDSRLKKAMVFRWAKWVLVAGIISLSSWLVYDMLQDEELSNHETQQELLNSNTQNTSNETIKPEDNTKAKSEFDLKDSSKTVENKLNPNHLEEIKQVELKEKIEPEIQNSKPITESIYSESKYQNTVVSEQVKMTEAIVAEHQNPTKTPEQINDSEEKTENIKDSIDIEVEETTSFSLEEAIQETLATELGATVTVEIDSESSSTSDAASSSSKNKDKSSKDKKKTKSKKKAKKTKFAKTTDRSSQGTNPKRLNAFLDIHAGGFMFNNAANSPTLYSDSLTSTNYTQAPQLSYDFGVGVQLKLKDKPWLLYTGIDYQVFKEKIDYNWTQSFEDSELSHWNYDSTFNIEQVIDTFFIIIDTNQFVIDTIFTQDTVLANIDSTYNKVMSSNEENKKYTNTYTYLNIPLMIGYEFQTNNKNWNFQVLGGAAIAINLSNDGYYYTKDGGIQEYSGKVNPSLTWKLMAAANVNYQWKKWQFYIQPEFQYQLNESEIPNQPIRRQYQLYKIKAGIRFKIF